MDTEHVTLNQLVAFAVLMENNEGIINKAPSYIKEKFNACMQTTNSRHLKAIMDSSNRAEFDAWREKWTSRK
ncbi:hypothetical protein ES703_98224 [subsurface metagenome]